MQTLGDMLKGLAYLIFIVCGLWGFILELSIIYQAVGLWLVIVGIVLFPVTLAVAPWYALIAYGNWFPLALIYGGGIAGSIIGSIGSRLAGD